MKISVEEKQKDISVYESVVQRYEEKILDENHEWQARDVYEDAVNTAKALRLSFMMDMFYDKKTENRLNNAVLKVAKKEHERENRIINTMEDLFNYYASSEEECPEGFFFVMQGLGVKFEVVSSRYMPGFIIDTLVSNVELCGHRYAISAYDCGNGYSLIRHLHKEEKERK